MSTPCDNVGEFVDGELSAVDAAAFREHLVDCAQCQADVKGFVHLELLRPPQAAPKIIPFRSRRIQAVLVPLAVAASVLLTLRWWPSTATDALELPPYRQLEARLSHPLLAGHRPYGVERGASATEFALPLEQLARLQRKGELHALASAYLAYGQPEQARPNLERAPTSPDVESDRAVVDMSAAQWESALQRLDTVLAARPNHPQAMWNRALVLRELGLKALAARAFETVALRGEAGWADEARQRGRALEAELASLRDAWEQVRAQGQLLVKEGTPIDLNAARQSTGLARLYLYDAIRSAPTEARVRSLKPLAEMLDEQSKQPVLALTVQATAQRFSSTRADLAEAYRTLALGGAAANEDVTRWLNQARARGDDDLFLGFLLQSDRAGQAPDDYASAAERLNDPWFSRLAVQVRAASLIASGQLPQAEAMLSHGLEACAQPGIEYRCAHLELLMTNLLLQQHRLPEAVQHIARGRALAASDWGLELSFLSALGDSARLRNGVSLAQAYLGERLARQPDDCSVQRHTHLSLAAMQMLQLDAPKARAELQQAPTCGEPLTLQAALLIADLQRFEPRPAEVTEALASLHARGDPSALARFIEGRLEASRSSERAEALWQEALVLADAQPSWVQDAQKARAYSHSALAMEAARRGDFARGLSWLAAATHQGVPQQCAVAVSTDDERYFAVAVAKEGAVVGHFSSGRTAPEVLPPLPESLLQHLADCVDVAVLAAPPWHGRAGLLPPEFAWSYRSRETRPKASKPARRLVISDVEPPAALGKPRLRAWSDAASSVTDVKLVGALATPRRVLAAMQDATEIELHAHGLVNLAFSDASFVALSEEPDGSYALTASAVTATSLRGSPLVVLAACQAAQVAPYLHEAWSLPIAFVRAGASGVLASPAQVHDADAGAFFDAVLARVRAGQSASTSLRDERMRWLRREPNSWVSEVVLFQ